MTGRPWLTGDLRRLRDLCEAAVAPRLIAAELHRSLPAIYDQMQRLGIRSARRRRRDPKAEAAAGLHAEIAAALKDNPGLRPYREAR